MTAGCLVFLKPRDKNRNRKEERSVSAPSSIPCSYPPASCLSFTCVLARRSMLVGATRRTFFLKLKLLSLPCCSPDEMRSRSRRRNVVEKTIRGIEKGGRVWGNLIRPIRSMCCDGSWWSHPGRIYKRPLVPTLAFFKLA